MSNATIIFIGVGTMMGAAGASYEKGLLGVIADPFGGALCLFLVGFFFVRIFRRLRLLTFIDFFDNRYGKTAATIAAVGSISSNIGWTGALLVAFGFVFQTLTGVPVEMGIIASVTMPGLTDPETVVPQMALAYLHPVAIAIFVGALLAAIMSSADSALLAAASVFSTNILPLFKPQVSDQRRLLATRIAIPVFGSIAMSPCGYRWSTT
ncbi:MAG: hypothetical protein ABGY96_18510 [bacterium]|nr:hypothetical protein [Gammaproteobacteria bacterium]HIL97897.1 hypothetical protein [Pseudomonadales bacterium]